MKKHNNKMKNSADALISRSIWVCGCGRSGTSIFSSLLASHKEMEYAFDPPILHWIFGFYDRLDDDIFSQLIKIYIYREVFRNALAGRNLNMNVTDQSFVLNFKDLDEINFRKERSLYSWLNYEAEKKYRVCIKLTDTTFLLEVMNRLFPELSCIGIVRNPFSVVSSVHKKGWFDRDNIAFSLGSETLPIKIDRDIGAIPFWLEERDYARWMNGNVWERSALYCLRATNALLKHRDAVSIVNYDWFVKQPEQCIAKLQEHFRIQATDKTDQLLKKVTYHPKSLVDDLRNVVSRSTMEELHCLAQSLSDVTLELK